MVTSHNCRRVRILGVVLLAMLSACSGLDPRKFGHVRYGMTNSQMEHALETPGEPLLRLVGPRTPDGTSQDVIISRYPTMHPHPTYFAILVDDVLESVLTYGRARQCGLFESPRTRARVTQLAASARLQRLPLAWEQLEAIDAPEQSTQTNPTTVTIITILGMPPVWVLIPLLPVAIPLTLWMQGDVVERRAAMQAALLAVPADARRATIAAAIGAPSRVQENGNDAGIEVWEYDVRDGHSVAPGFSVGFLRDQLLWIDFYYSAR